MITSESTDQLYPALLEAQKSFPPLKKDKEVEVTTRSGGKYKFKYATFDLIIGEIVPKLREHGVIFTQTIEMDRSLSVKLTEGNKTSEFEIVTCSVITRLIHISGQWQQTAVPIQISAKDTAQEIGSKIQYGKRYGFCGALGLVADDDDDANVSDGNDVAVIPTKPQNKQTTKPATKATRGVDGIKQIDPVASGDTAESLASELALIQNRAALDAWYKKYEAIINGLPESLKVGVRAGYGNKLDQFKVVEGKSKAA